MPDPLSHHKDMSEIPLTSYDGRTYNNQKFVVYLEHKLPDWWWLNPWRHVKALTSAISALNSLTRDLEDNNTRLLEQLNELEVELEASQDKFAALKLKYLQLHIPKKKSK